MFVVRLSWSTDQYSINVNVFVIEGQKSALLTAGHMLTMVNSLVILMLEISNVCKSAHCSRFLNILPLSNDVRYNDIEIFWQ